MKNSILPTLMESLAGLTKELQPVLMSPYARGASEATDNRLVELLTGALLDMTTQKAPFDVAKAKDTLWTLNVAQVLGAEITKRGLDQ